MFYSGKNTVKRIKWKPTDWYKILLKLITNKKFASKILKVLLKFTSKKKNNPIKMWEKDLNRHLNKEIYSWQIHYVKMLNTIF